MQTKTVLPCLCPYCPRSGEECVRKEVRNYKQKLGGCSLLFRRGTLSSTWGCGKRALSQLFVYVVLRSLKGRSLIHPSRLSEECDSFTISSFGPVIPVTLGGTCSKGQGDKEAATPSMPTHFLFHKFTVRCNIIFEMVLIL